MPKAKRTPIELPSQPTPRPHDDALMCPNCGSTDFFQLPERGEWILACCDCGRRVLAGA